MVNEASDVDCAAGGTRDVAGVVGGVVKVASSIGGAVGAGGTDSVGSSSCYSACGGTGYSGLGGAATGAE